MAKERQTFVNVKLVDVINSAKAYPNGLLAVLVDYDVDSTVFDSEAVRAMVVSESLHILLLLLLLST